LIGKAFLSKAIIQIVSVPSLAKTALILISFLFILSSDVHPYYDLSEKQRKRVRREQVGICSLGQKSIIPHRESTQRTEKSKWNRCQKSSFAL